MRRMVGSHPSWVCVLKTAGRSFLHRRPSKTVPSTPGGHISFSPSADLMSRDSAVIAKGREESKQAQYSTYRM